MRGEHDVLEERLFAMLGSSPHARGTLKRDAPRLAGEGIIPACAGNTNA